MTQRESEKQLNRETRRYLILPMIGAGGVVVLGVVIALLLPSRFQISIIADWMTFVLMLCPLVICLFPLSVVLIVAIFGLAKLSDEAAKPLRRAEDFSKMLADRVVKTTDTINKQTINASARFAFVDRLLSAFDPPPNGDVKKED